MAPDPPIVRTDFPIARRGYEPDAVRAHLEQVEAAVARLRAAAERPPAPPSAAEAASGHVREIVAAAERSAAAIRADAERDAARIRATASEDAQRARDAVAAVRERAGELERDLGALGEQLRMDAPVAPVAPSVLSPPAGAAAPAHRSSPPQASAATAPEHRSPPPPASPAAPPEPATHAADDDAPAPGAGPPAAADALAAARAGAATPAAQGRSTDEEEARLVALDLALAGTSREDVDRELARSYDVG